jgi:hypothetical protein
MHFISFDEFVDSWTDNWKLLYHHELTRDYYWYSRVPNWYNIGSSQLYNTYGYMCGIYDIFNIFEYSQDRYQNLLIRMFKSYWLENNGFTQIEHFYNCFKEDFLINEEWFTLNLILGPHFVDVEPLPFGLVKNWTNLYVWELNVHDWRKQGFMKLFTKKEIVKIC